MALRAFPFIIFIYFNFTIKATNLAIVRLGIEFSILNMLIDILDNFTNCFQVILKIGNLHITNMPTRSNRLELSFKVKLIKSINILSRSYMIGIGIPTLISDMFNIAKMLFIILSSLL